MLYVKTNNDLEGLHNLWNKIGKAAKLPFYKLTDVLLDIAKEVTLVSSMLCYEKLKRRVKKSTKMKNSILFELWEEYQLNETYSLELLKKIVSSVKTCLPHTINPMSSIPITLEEEEEW